MQNQNQVMVQQPMTLDVMLGNQIGNEIASGGLPKDFNKARFVQNCMALINSNQDFNKFPPQAIIGNLIKAAYLSLDFYNKEVWLIPYGGQLDFSISGKGMKKLAKQHSTRPIRDIYAKVIRQGDELVETVVNGEPSINFKPKMLNDGEIIGAFAVCLFADGGMQYEILTKNEIDTIRRKSKAANSPAWKDFYGEMARKSAMKRLCKNIDIEFDNPNQRDAYDSDMALDDGKSMRAEQPMMENSEDFIEDGDMQ